MSIIKAVVTSILLGIAGMFGSWLWTEVLESKMNDLKEYIVNKQKVRAA